MSIPSFLSRTTTLSIILGFFALTFLVYGVSLSNHFVAWDDNYVVDFNPVVHGFTWDHMVKNFTSFVDPELYDPLTFVSYQFDYTIGGIKPFIFHLDNLILHTLNALLVALFIFLLSKRGHVALFCGLIFAIHPLNTEAVAWASARKDTLSTFFFLLSLIGYLYFRSNHRDHSKLWYALSLVAFLFGLLSKVMIVMLPIVLLLIDYLEKRKWSWNVLIEKVPYFILSGIFGVVALLGKSNVVGESTIFQKMLMACKSTIFYLEKLFVPINLSVIYPYTKTIALSSPDFFIPVLLILSLIIATWYFRIQKREVTFGILFFLITLIPTFFNFAKGGEFYFASDRYTYIPEIGILFLIVTIAYDVFGKMTSGFFGKKETSQRNVSIDGAFVIVVLAFAVAAYQQSLVWHDTETLFLQTLHNYPDALVARINLGLVYRESGLQVKAMEQFNKALALRPNNALVHTNIGATDEKLGKMDEAIAEYQKAIALGPKEPDAYFALGMMKERDGKIDEAFTLYKKVEELSPGYIGVYNNLGSIYVDRHDFVSAAAAYQKAIDIDPYYADAHFNLAFVSEKLNKLDDAAREYETTLKLEGETAKTLTALVGVYAEQNKTPETVRTLKRLLAVDPTNDFALKFMESLKAHGLVSN